MAIVRFPRFCPDQSIFSPEATDVIKNVKPTKDGWGPIHDLLPLSDPLDSDPRGAFATKSDAGNWYIFAGTATDLWMIDTTTYAWTNVSRALADYNLGDGFFWEFERFGNRVIATAKGSDFPQFIDLDFVGVSTFDDLPGATFEAELVFVVGDYLCFARINGDNRKLRWSGVNDTEWWTNGQRGADEQQLPDGGSIMRGLAQDKNCLLIQETRMRYMTFDPSYSGSFNIQVANPDAGAFASRAIINIGPNDFLWLAHDGFYRGLQALPIGAERVDRWFFDNVSPDKIDLVSAQKDPFEKIVWFRFETVSGVNRLLGFDWQLNEWFYAEIDALVLFEAATPGISLDDLDAFGDLDELPYSLDSRAWQGGIPSMAGFDSDFRFGFFNGANLEATLETEDKMLNYPRLAQTDRVNVLVDTNSFTCAVGTRDNTGEVRTWSADTAPEAGTNFVTLETSARYHKFRVKIAADTIWQNAVGIDPAFVDGGMW